MIDSGGDYPVLGAAELFPGYWLPASWTDAGVYDVGIVDSHMDLVEAKQRVKLYIYQGSAPGYFWCDKVRYSGKMYSSLFAVVEIEEGQGL
jgi:hypothetical protein